VRNPVPRTTADGQQLQTLGERPWEVIRSRVDEIVTVSDAQIVATMELLFERLKVVVEPSGAAALAALRAGAVLAEGSRAGVLLSGGNVSLERFTELVAGERGAGA
jgi:threonine dehydratase